MSHAGLSLRTCHDGFADCVFQADVIAALVGAGAVQVLAADRGSEAGRRADVSNRRAPTGLAADVPDGRPAVIAVESTSGDEPAGSRTDATGSREDATGSRKDATYSRDATGSWEDATGSRNPESSS